MTTKSMRVVAREGVRIRNAPRHRAAIMGSLSRNQVVEVAVESCQVEASTGYVWWEHTSRPGFWSASGQAGTQNIFMEDYALPHEAPPPDDEDRVWMRVVAEKLTVRTAPRLGSNRVLGQSLRVGQTVPFSGPSQRADGFIWWEHAEHPGWWSASGSTSGGQTFMTPQPQTIDDHNTETLEVPWMTQIQDPPNYKNDCGHACLLMIMRYRGYAQGLEVKDLYFYEKPGDPDYYKVSQGEYKGCTNPTQLQRMAEKATNAQFQPQVIKVDATAENLEVIRDQIRADKPVILLVWYPELHINHLTNENFDHWLVVTGFVGDTFYINDPLWRAEADGERIPILASTLLRACQAARSSPGKFLGVS